MRRTRRPSPGRCPPARPALCALSARCASVAHFFRCARVRCALRGLAALAAGAPVPLRAAALARRRPSGALPGRAAARRGSRPSVRRKPVPFGARCARACASLGGFVSRSPGSLAPPPRPSPLRAPARVPGGSSARRRGARFARAFWRWRRAGAGLRGGAGAPLFPAPSRRAPTVRRGTTPYLDK